MNGPPQDENAAYDDEGAARLDDVGERVRTLLAAARLPAHEAQIIGLVAAYRVQRPAVDALFEVPAARYARPVLRRDAHVQPEGEPDAGR
ncbi:hypothetical protein [Streptomyces lasiicapitis]|uniref:hypothetical protein n=1 Tax=Streptomyces lasiicapitis TaxID=1923961 RepID=UPI0036BF71CF